MVTHRGSVLWLRTEVAYCGTTQWRAMVTRSGGVIWLHAEVRTMVTDRGSALKFSAIMGTSKIP